MNEFQSSSNCLSLIESQGPTSDKEGSSKFKIKTGEIVVYTKMVQKVTSLISGNIPGKKLKISNGLQMLPGPKI